MRRLIYYEMKKNFFTKPMFLLICIFMLVNALKIYSVSKEKSPFSKFTESCYEEAYEELYGKYKGELTEENVDEIMALYHSLNEKVADLTYSTEKEEGSMTINTFSDFLLIKSCFIKDIEYETGYQKYAEQIVKHSLDNIKFYENIGNGYEARLHYEIAKAFYERKLTKFHNTDGFRNLLYYDFSGIIILMLTLLGCSSVFIKEKETEMIVLLKTSAGGKTETFMAKMMACILFLSSICILYSVEDYLLFTVGFGKMDAYLDPIYMLDSFKDSLLNINLLSFYGVCVVSRIIGSITIGMLFVIGSLYGKNSLQVILINFGILIGIVGLFHLFSNISRFINPLMLFFGRKLFMKQNFVNICGYPIWESVIVYSCSIFFCVIEVLWMKKRWERG